MTADLRVSLPPELLGLARRRAYSIELKFDWEHREILSGERDLAHVVAEHGIDPDRIRTVHLPPGTRRRGDRIGMAITPANRGAIVEFVHEQLAAIPDATLVAHPPKSFQYGELLSLIEELCSITDRELAIENAAVESDWYSPEQIAFFAVAADADPALDGLGLTIDSAHLPRSTTESPAVDPTAIETLEARLREEGFELSPVYEQRVLDRSPPEWWPSGVTAGDPYAPLLTTLWLCGDRVRTVHLNDPETDGVPVPDPHDEQPGLDAALARFRATEVVPVIEPGPLLDEPKTLHERVDAVRAALDE